MVTNHAGKTYCLPLLVVRVITYGWHAKALAVATLPPTCYGTIVGPHLSWSLWHKSGWKFKNCNTYREMKRIYLGVSAVLQTLHNPLTPPAEVNNSSQPVIDWFNELHDWPHLWAHYCPKTLGKIPPPLFCSHAAPLLLLSIHPAPPLHPHPLTSSPFLRCSFFHSFLSFVLWDAGRKRGKGRGRDLLLAFRWFHMKSLSTHLGCRHRRPLASHLLPLSRTEFDFNCLCTA